MAQPTGTYSSYDAVGIREDLSDIIANIARTDTPFQSAIKKEKADSRLHEWLTDTLDAPTDNKQIEGDAATITSRTPKVRLNNHCQILSKVPSVTGTNEAVKHAGISRVMGEEKMNRAKEIKRDLEHALVGLNNAKVAGNDTTARELASVQSWIATNENKAADGTTPTGDGTDARVDGTQRAFLETYLKDVLQQIYTSGGRPTMLMSAPFNHQVISSFTGGSTKQHEAKDKTVYAQVTRYISPFGQELNVICNWIQRARDVLVIDPRYWALAWLRNWTGWDLSRTGDSMEYQMIGEVTLAAKEQKSSGIIADLTTS